MKFSKRICLQIIFLLSAGTMVQSQPEVKSIRLTDFQMQSSSVTGDPGERISLPDYKPHIYWFPVKVPTTVLNGLVKNKIYPDPYMGLNNMLIPDASDEFNKIYDLEQYSYLPNDPNPWKKPYWFRTEFSVPSTFAGKHFELVFKGINYRAEVWVNGKCYADSTRMAGMFAQYSLDISDAVITGGKNAVAVKIYPLDYPGLPSTEQLEVFGDFYPNGGPTGDIGKNVTMLCSVGWDWVPPVRDRNMGIWLPVYLKISGGVTFADPKLVTILPDASDTTKAKLTAGLVLKNHNNITQNGNLVMTLTPENFSGRDIVVRQKVRLGPSEAQTIKLSPDTYKELNISDPALWWPNGQGKPNLYKVNLRFTVNEKVVNDTSFLYGMRVVSTKAVEVNGTWRRDFYVNGRRIHLTGGAWVPDFMLNRDSLRYDYELKLCRNANINLVRIWGGGVTPCDEFFDACDRYGLLVWSDFWITGDTQGEFKGSPDWPLDGDVFRKNVLSTILRIRNHPSLLVWTGGNEGHARRELYDYMRNSIIELDGTRPFIPSSSGFARLPEGWPASWPDNLPAGVYSGGPYTWQDPASYYKRAITGRDWVFKDETGIPSMVPYSSLPKVIPDLVWDKTKPFPLNNTWGYHDAATGNGRWNLYYSEMIKRYGEPSGMEDFCNKMQLMNSTGYQGIFEAAGHKLNEIGGVMLWKLNAAFPSVVWQVYDWFLQPNAGYYAMQNACEPLHVQLNLSNRKVMVLNRTYKNTENLKVTAEVYNTGSELIVKKEEDLKLDPSSVIETIDLADIVNQVKGVSFVVLNLSDRSGRKLSHNVYWLSGNNDYRALASLDKAEIGLSVIGYERNEKELMLKLKVTNKSGKIAFFIRPQIMSSGEEVLPTFWSSSYFTLAPGESIDIKGACPLSELKGGKAGVQISGLNIPVTISDLF